MYSMYRYMYDMCLLLPFVDTHVHHTSFIIHHTSDFLRPGTNDPMPGLIGNAYAEMGGTVHYVGKPHPAVYQACFEALALDHVSHVSGVGPMHERCFALFYFIRPRSSQYSILNAQRASIPSGTVQYSEYFCQTVALVTYSGEEVVCARWLGVEGTQFTTPEANRGTIRGDAAKFCIILAVFEIGLVVSSCHG